MGEVETKTPLARTAPFIFQHYVLVSGVCCPNPLQGRRPPRWAYSPLAPRPPPTPRLGSRTRPFAWPWTRPVTPTAPTADECASASPVVSARRSMLWFGDCHLSLEVTGAADAAGRCGPVRRSQTEQSLKGGHRLSPAIVTKNELIQVDGKLNAADAVVSADQPLLRLPMARSASGTTDGTPRPKSRRRGWVRAMCRPPAASSPVNDFSPSV